MPWHFKLWLCLEKWILIQPVYCLCALSHICLLYWHKRIFITATITVPIYLQAAGWPVICCLSCSLNNIVSSALIVDDILALMLGMDSAWPLSTKKFVTVYFFLYMLGGNSLLGTCWFCHKWTVFDTTRAAVRGARVQDTSLVNLRSVQQMHMLTLWSVFRGNILVRLAPFVWAEYSEPPTCFPVFSLGLVRLPCTQNFTIKRYDACFGSVVDTCFGSVVVNGIIFSIKPG